MAGTFPILEITKDMILGDEPMGSKEKFWCRIVANGPKWLFKHPREESGKMEHIAEKLAQEIGDLLGVPCARIECAQFEGKRGTVSKDVQEQDEALVHGNEIIAGRVTGYDPLKKRHTSDHTFDRIQQ